MYRYQSEIIECGWRHRLKSVIALR